MGISLRRKTSGGSYIAAIDGLRFVAIMGVVLFHAREYALGSTDGALGALASRGWFGVELFFVISGVVLALPLAKHFLSGTPRPSLRRFYLSRFTRIGPPYWIALLVYLVGKASLGQHGLFPNFLASSCYVHNLVYGRGSLVCGVAWTLEIEVQFYLISPFIGQVFAIRNRSVRRATLGLSILAFTLLSARLDSGFPYLLPYMFYFLAGYLLADIYVADLSVEKPPAPDWRWDVLGSVAWLALWIWLDYRPAILRIAVPWLRRRQELTCRIHADSAR